MEPVAGRNRYLPWLLAVAVPVCIRACHTLDSESIDQRRCPEQRAGYGICGKQLGSWRRPLWRERPPHVTGARRSDSSKLSPAHFTMSTSFRSAVTAWFDEKNRDNQDSLGNREGPVCSSACAPSVILTRFRCQIGSLIRPGARPCHPPRTRPDFIQLTRHCTPSHVRLSWKCRPVAEAADSAPLPPPLQLSIGADQDNLPNGVAFPQ